MIRVHWTDIRGNKKSETFESREEFEEELIARWAHRQDSHKKPRQTEYLTVEDVEKIHGETLAELESDPQTCHFPIYIRGHLRSGTPVYCTEYGETGTCHWSLKKKTDLELAKEWATDDGASFRIEEIEV